MNTDITNDKELFRHLALISNEVVQIQRALQMIDSKESRLRSALDELVLDKETLIEQTNRLQSMVKEAATSAVEDDERERRFQKDEEDARSALVDQVKEMEQTLETKEATVKELKESFAARLDELNKEIKEKDNLLQVRDIVLKDLKSAAESMNLLADGLATLQDARVIPLEDAQNDQAEHAKQEIKRVEERLSTEIDRLKSAVRDKEFALAAKSAEIERIREKSAARMKELEQSLEVKKKRKSPGFVTFIADRTKMFM